MYSAIPPSYLLFEITPLSSKSHCIILNTTNVSKSKIITGIAFLNIEKSNVNSAKKANTEIIAIQEILMSLEISIPLNAEYILANLNNDTSSNCSFVISNSSILTVFAYFSKYSL